MKVRSLSSLLLGVGVGYALNTPAGKAVTTKAAAVVRTLLGRPDVQRKVADLGAQAQRRTGDLPDPVQKAADAAVNVVVDQVGKAGETTG